MKDTVTSIWQSAALGGKDQDLGPVLPLTCLTAFDVQPPMLKLSPWVQMNKVKGLDSGPLSVLT